MANSNQFQPGLRFGSAPLGRQPRRLLCRPWRVPVGLPRLGRGRHQRAQDGACLDGVRLGRQRDRWLHELLADAVELTCCLTASSPRGTPRNGAVTDLTGNT